MGDLLSVHTEYSNCFAVLEKGNHFRRLKQQYNKYCIIDPL